MANTSIKATSTTSVNESAPVETTPVPQTQVFFVPDYGVSVEATSLEEAITLAKKAKGKK